MTKQEILERVCQLHAEAVELKKKLAALADDMNNDRIFHALGFRRDVVKARTACTRVVNALITVGGFVALVNAAVDFTDTGAE